MHRPKLVAVTLVSGGVGHGKYEKGLDQTSSLRGSGRYIDPAKYESLGQEDREMKNPRPAATYANENSCLEDVLEIANELASRNHQTRYFGVRKKQATDQRVKRQNGIH